MGDQSNEFNANENYCLRYGYEECIHCGHRKNDCRDGVCQSCWDLGKPGRTEMQLRKEKRNMKILGLL